ncbi:hypothetical protein BCR44DRAFT_117163 [Catenaria anguillulae PL171]|uniref:dolichol kinase n=1 Tax=Catenaria anguillulae PL171 TaxID=765915 RepID=A0A1Y2HHK8_9FUNG|nr:hypothetical protein BCR44DRAFT_117163 [Catenaria anguillulae PL171]
MAACTAGDLVLEHRRLRRIALAADANHPGSASPSKSPARQLQPSGQLPLERATRSLSSPGLLYGLCILPALFLRSSYASFVSHAMAWSMLGLLTTLLAYLTRLCPPRLLSRAFQLALIAHLVTPSNPWTVIALALTAAPTLLYAFPRAFALGEVLAVSTALVLVADSLRARPHAAHVVVAAMQHLALGTATAAAVAAPWVKRLMSLSKGKGKPEQMVRERRRATVGLYLVLAGVVGGLITPLMYVRSGYEPWTWVIGYIASSRAHMLMTAYWLFVLSLGFTFFPWRRSANTQRKTYHLLAIAILLPGYLWTPVFLSLALTVALSAFVFAELLRLAQAPPLGPLLESALGTFRDHRDEALVLTSHVYLLLGLALPVWVGVIEGTWRAGLAGMAALGVGDAVASLVGRRFGTWRWFPGCDKSVQGSAGFVAGTLAFFVAVGEPLTLPLVGAVVATAGVEAVSSQFDNFVVPLVMLLTIM